MNIKKPSFSNILFFIFLALLIIPQTRTPIQVAVNKLKVLVWSPSVIDEKNQKQLTSFGYKLINLKGIATNKKIGNGKVAFISYWETWCPP